jgi:hypothetical protein
MPPSNAATAAAIAAGLNRIAPRSIAASTKLPAAQKRLFWLAKEAAH